MPLALDANHNEIASSLTGEQDGPLGHAFSYKCWDIVVSVPIEEVAANISAGLQLFQT